jgi:Mn-dependent DtxR family transcriptional regulator
MEVQETAEMYLETILVIEQRKGNVRAVDIAKEMGYSKPTISEQMKKFRENGFIQIDEGQNITLSEKGRTIAERIYDRHETIAKMLIKLGVSEEPAYIDACKIEHDICEETFQCIKNYLK